MCKAFSCIVDSLGKVTWKLGVDSHSDLAKLGGYADKVLGEFAKIEITPRNGDYLNPDSWRYSVDESPVPNWCGTKEKELCRAAHKKWLKALDKFIIRHPIVQPFKLVPPKTIQPKHIRLLKKWASLWASVWASAEARASSVWASSFWASVRASSLGASVRASAEARASVWALVWASLGALVGASAEARASVWASVRASVWAYTGTFFNIPVRKCVKHPKGKYPYQPLVTLWNAGLVPSFDGTTWRLHGGPKAEVLFSITKDDLKKYR